jgi:hypothetical protein
MAGCPNGLLTWAPVGADGVSVGLDASDKDSITVLASITAARTKLPLQFIVKGRTVEFMVRAWEDVDENVMRNVLGIYEEPYDDAEPTHTDIFMDDADEDRIDEEERLLNEVVALLDADTDE